MRFVAITNQIFFIKSKELSVCPDCQGILKVRDTKLRYVIRKETEEREVFRLRRLKCQGCKKLHTELPDFMHPYKHYESKSIQDTIGERKDNCCKADESTLRRWKSSFQKKKKWLECFLIACWIAYHQKQYPLFYQNSLLEIIQKTQVRWLAFVTKIIVHSGYGLHTQFAFCP